MANYLDRDTHRLHDDPLILIVPGLHNSNPQHWQSLWLAQRGDCRRVDLGMWDNPHRKTWVNKLNLAIIRADRPVVLVAHSLGCLAVAWWARYENPAFGNPVVGALMVAPPDVDRPGVDPRLARFSACPRAPLPFPSFLAASENDTYCKIRTARMLARDWGSRFAFAGAIGHINAESGIGDWDFGKVLLGQLLKEHRRTYPRPATDLDLRADPVGERPFAPQPPASGMRAHSAYPVLNRSRHPTTARF